MGSNKAMRSAGVIRLALVVLVLLIGFSAGLVWISRGDRNATTQIRNVVLISIDTCRADHLSCYGFDRKTTPNIDRVAEQGILFENVFAPVPLTLPAHSSMLTGTIPPHHGVRDNTKYRLLDSNLTLAEILKKKGLATAAVVSAAVLSTQVGLSQGFDSYDDEFEDSLVSVGIQQRRAEEVSRAGIEWLQQHQDEPFFLFLHYYDPHHDYEPPEPFATRFSDNLYAGEIAYTDHWIGQVIDHLKTLDLYDSTLLIITADHGEMLGEHGEPAHGYFIYQNAIRVPLIFKLPAEDQSQRLDQLAGVVDLTPTICSLLGVDTPDGIQGTDLSRFFYAEKGGESNRHLYCESLTPTQYNVNSLMGFVSPHWKFIQTTNPELYHLIDDPREAKNLAVEQPARVTQMQQRLGDLLDSLPDRDDESRFRALDQDTHKQIEALGYVGVGTIDEDIDFNSDKPDPKDHLDQHLAFMDLGTALFDEQLEKAAELIEMIITRWPDFYGGYNYRAQLSMQSKDYSAAVENFRLALERKGADADIHYQLGEALNANGKPQQAAEQLQKTLELQTDHLNAMVGLGKILLEQGRHSDAMAQFDQALAQFPEEAAVHFSIGHALQTQGMVDQAIGHLREGLKLDPDGAEGHYNLGTLLVSKGHLDEGIEHLQHTLQLEPEHVEAHTNLGNGFQMVGRLEEAVSHYRQALKYKPDHIKAHINLAVVSFNQKKLASAAVHYRRAVELQPDDASLHHRLAHVLQSQGQLDEAIDHYQKTLKLEPDLPAVHFALGRLLISQRQTEPALVHLRAAVQLKPNLLEAANSLAWNLATMPELEAADRQEAVRLAERAAELSEGRSAAILDTLAAAYAAVGKFEKAVSSAQAALSIMLASNGEQHAELVKEMRDRLKLYKLGQTYLQHWR